jgi:SAM-dependent methyltransferase
VIDRDTALRWIERWDSQQQGYLPDREDRFTALIDAVEEAAGRPDPLVLDIGSGPGSLAVRLLRRIPAATVIAIDADPLTLSLGRALIEREEQRRMPGGLPETWTDWWAAAAADPALAGLVAERAARWVDSEHHGSPAGRLSVQVAALRSAGFSEVGTLWQRGESRLLCGVLPG